ncbi:unnamed protein product [Diatraea saccharalis]|uniref:Uncharacterized protein n=1 Tax=Diatraea saccharalis TaxID=40085 RepID=A0A9P0C4V3_9NEOP|nr:unnamed protein product [Diatraea saccharalis]
MSIPLNNVSQSTIKISHETRDQNAELQQAKKFIAWYKQMIDNERQNLALYLSDDAILEWFGRTIKSRKKISLFFKHDMQYTRHDFISVRNIDKIQSRHERFSRNEEHNLCSFLNTSEVCNTKIERNSRKRILQSSSPEWADSCQPPEGIDCFESKKTKTNDIQNPDIDSSHDRTEGNCLKRGFNLENCSDFNSKGDGILGRRVRRKCIPVTPPNCELGQGDCMPSTSGTDSNRSHDALNAQLSKLFVECEGFVQFTRSKNCLSNDTMTWERKCKTQISFAEDPLNVGEYIIWAIHYTDESKCRRNLLSAFEEVVKEEGMTDIKDQ